jgi:hypothetical protein
MHVQYDYPNVLVYVTMGNVIFQPLRAGGDFGFVNKTGDNWTKRKEKS